MGAGAGVFLLGHPQFRQGIMSGRQASKQRVTEMVGKTCQLYLETLGSDGGGQSQIPLKKHSDREQSL